MARFFKHLLPFYLLTPLLLSCQEGGEAGDLFGQWRLSGSDTHYVSFSGSVTLFRCLDKGQVYGNFQHVGDSLFIQCFSVEGERRDTTIIEEAFGWKPMNNIRLKITTLDGDRLVVSSGQQMWSFCKY